MEYCDISLIQEAVLERAERCTDRKTLLFVLERLQSLKVAGPLESDPEKMDATVLQYRVIDGIQNCQPRDHHHLTLVLILEDFELGPGAPWPFDRIAQEEPQLVEDPPVSYGSPAHTLTEAQLRELNKRYKDWKLGKGEMIPWSEARKRIEGKQ